MGLRKFCDACHSEMDNYTVRPRLEIRIVKPDDGSSLVFLEFCDACYMKFREAISTILKEGIGSMMEH